MKNGNPLVDLLINSSFWWNLRPMLNRSSPSLRVLYFWLTLSNNNSNRGPALPLFKNISTGFQSQLEFTSKLPYLHSSHSTPWPHHICHPSFIHIFLCVPFALLVHIDSVSHMSVLYSAHVASDWPVQPFEIPCHSQLHLAPPSKKQLKTHLFASASPSSWIFFDGGHP